MSKYLDVALEAAVIAERVIEFYFNAELGLDSTTKKDGSPVTIADKEAEEAIIRHIKTAFPEHGVYGEEGGKKVQDSEYLWIIDPIDGTKNFTRGMPYFGTLIALMKNNEIIVGVSHMPLIHETLYAEKGQGAFLNGEPVFVSDVDKQKEMFLSFGSLKYFMERGMVDKILALQDVFSSRSYGNCHAYHMLACGQIDAVIEASTRLYDVAPFELIIKEAGGKASQMDGAEIGMETHDFLAANSELYDGLLKHFAD